MKDIQMFIIYEDRYNDDCGYNIYVAVAVASTKEKALAHVNELRLRYIERINAIQKHYVDFFKNYPNDGHPIPPVMEPKPRWYSNDPAPESFVEEKRAINERNREKSEAYNTELREWREARNKAYLEEQERFFPASETYQLKKDYVIEEVKFLG